MTLTNINFKSGVISYDEFNINPLISFEQQVIELDQDILQIKYKKNYTIDVGWLPDRDPNGCFILRIIKDFDWDNPITEKRTRSFEKLEFYLQESVDLIEKLIK